MFPEGKQENASAAGSQEHPASDEGSKAVMDASEVARRKHVVDQLKTGKLLIFDARAMFRKVAALREVHYKMMLKQSNVAFDAMVTEKSKQPSAENPVDYCAWMGKMHCANDDYRYGCTALARRPEGGVRDAVIFYRKRVRNLRDCFQRCSFKHRGQRQALVKRSRENKEAESRRQSQN